MPPAIAASITDFLLGLALPPAGEEAGNQFVLEGLSSSRRADGALEIAIRKFEATALRFTSGPLTLEVAKFALHQLVAIVRMEGGRPHLLSWVAAGADLDGAKVHGPLDLSRAAGGSPASQAPPASWSLAPLASAEGTLRAEIVDAHLLFDAEVTVPVRQGQVDFADATVEHVGPDSRMGASPEGIYVDAANGRSHLYRFPSEPAAGVKYEQRGALIGPFVTDRGSLQLQDFCEWLLRQPRTAQGLGFTDQARQLLARTAVAGEVRLGDGRFAAPGVQAELVGSAEGRNGMRLRSEAVGRGFTLEVDALSLRDAACSAMPTRMACDEMSGSLALRMFASDAQLRFEFDAVKLKMSGLRIDLPARE